MKILLLFIVILLIGVSPLRAQVLSEKINVEKGFEYNGIYLDREEIAGLLKKNEAAYRLYKPSKFHYTVSYVLISAGLAAIFAPLQDIIGDAIRDQDDNSKKHYGRFVGIGVGLLAVSIPFKRKAYRQTKNAVELYNSSLGSNLNQPPKTKFQVGFTGHGPGLIVKF